MSFKIDVSSEASNTFARLDRPTKKRMVRRFEELSQDPFNSRLSTPLTNKGDLRKSRIGGWRIIFLVDHDELLVLVITIARRGQVYKSL